MPLKDLWREPLLHFLLIGAGLFGLYAMQNEIEPETPNRIVITPGQTAQLVDRFQRTWSRKPTDEEMRGLIENFVREEIFYREALAMGLDRDDPLVRQRMRQKLEFMLEDLSAATIDEAGVADYFARNAERYRIESQLTFRQVYLDPARHADLDTAMAKLRIELENGADPETVGDRTMLPPAFELASESELARNFGAQFATQVLDLPVSSWTGPVYSAFGAHLVRIDERVDARIPELAEVRAEVRRDYQVERQREQKDLAYQQLREGYEVIVEASVEQAQ